MGKSDKNEYGTLMCTMKGKKQFEICVVPIFLYVKNLKFKDALITKMRII